MSPAFGLLNVSVAVFSDTAPPEIAVRSGAAHRAPPVLFIYAPDGGKQRPRS
jgi:hypothetical protein